MPNLALYVILRAAAAVLPYVPLRIVYALASSGGAAAYFLVRPAREAILQNLAVVVGADNTALQHGCARRAFQNDAKNWVDTLRIGTVADRWLEERVQVDGWSNLDAALSEGKGAIMVTAHLGNYDLVGQLLALRGYRLTVPVERMQPEALFRFLTQRRASRGVAIIPIEEAPRRLLQALRAGELVGITGDRGAGGRSVTVDFLGKPAALPRGAVALAQRTGAPLLLALGLREGSTRYHGYIVPIEISGRSDAEGERDDVQRVADALGVFIRRFPEQWLAFTPIWQAPRLVAATMGQQKSGGAGS